MVGASELKLAVNYLEKEYSVSQRRACKVLDAPRSVIRYVPVLNDDEVIKNKILKIAEKRPRFGSPRIHQMLLREGVSINHKRTERLYDELHLSLRKKKTRKRFKSEVRLEPHLPTKRTKSGPWILFMTPLPRGEKSEVSLLQIFLQESHQP